MIDIDLPLEQGYDFMSKIPEQREVVDNMINDGIITSYSVSADRSKLWVLMEANDTHEVEYNLQKFAIINDITYHIHELLFSQQAMINIPQFSLN